MAVNPEAKSNINPITVAMGEDEVEKVVTITNNSTLAVFEPFTKTTVQPGGESDVLVQGSQFTAGVQANLAAIEALAGADILGVVVANPTPPAADAWDNIHVNAGTTADVDGAVVTFTGAGSGGRAAFNVGKTAGKWALNLSITGLDTADGNILQAGWFQADEADVDPALGDALVMALGLSLGFGASKSPGGGTALLVPGAVPSAVTIAIVIDADAGTWGIVDYAGDYEADCGALENVEGETPEFVGGIASGEQVFPFVALTNGGGNPAFEVAVELLSENITGVPAGYTALVPPSL